MAVRAGVVVVSGHMVDAPDRPRPRFPPDQVPRVTNAIRQALDQWKVGPETTVITGGARGADVIGAEEARRRGARVRLVLALPPEKFEQRSIALPGTDWLARFRAMLEDADVEVLDAGAGSDVFARTNARIVELARELDPEPRAIVVWNGGNSDGPGGTRDFITRLGYDRPNERVRVIDPTRRAYEARQAANGPKKLLALDGGGIRGTLTLEVLAALESKLRERYGPGCVLSDFFDYIGGTSTGAIIAAALALGQPVGDIRRKYETLARRVFKKRFLPLQLRSLYRDGPLRRELVEFFGADRTLGDPELRSLLLIVLHNAVSDSPWPLSNCTQARYNRADRYLGALPDRNLDLPLATLIRGSTAAPVYFPPEELSVGKHRFLFQDGGVTPFNNPALLMFLMATLPEYGLGWPVGEAALLLVSIGTGSSAAAHPGLLARRVWVGFHAKNLPSVFTNGASVGQDLICRSLGRTRAGDPIDLEFGDRVDVTGIGGASHFTYLRYNADLSSRALERAGITKPHEQEGLRELDSVAYIPQLQRLGQRIGATIELERHFAGFL
jgi:hypothetical protein